VVKEDRKRDKPGCSIVMSWRIGYIWEAFPFPKSQTCTGEEKSMGSAITSLSQIEW